MSNPASTVGSLAGLRAAWNAEREASETGQGFDPWRRARVTQLAVAWVLQLAGTPGPLEDPA